MSTHTITMSAQEFMAEAGRRTGITALKDADIEESLTRLLVSLNTEAQLSEAGAFGIQRLILRVLGNRLRMLRDLRRYPEIHDQQIVRPLIVAPGPRSGSTKLHKLLAAGGDFLYLTCWQGLNPALFTGDPAEDPAPRISDADGYARWFSEHSPRSKLIHEYSTLEPEEENLILEHRLNGVFMMPFLFVPGYMTWYTATFDFTEDLKYVKQVIQYLQWQFHRGDTRPWLLKNPMYIGREDKILEVFPDASIVTMHRDPVSVVSSGNSLQTYFRQAYSDADYRAGMGLELTEGIGGAWATHMAVRDRHPEIRYHDIGYTELTQHIEVVIRRLYAHIGLPLKERSLAAMLRWERDNRIHKHGAHTHGLEGHGASAEFIREKFKPYIDRFKAYF